MICKKLSQIPKLLKIYYILYKVGIMLKDFSANKIDLIRNADNYTMYEAKFGVDDDILKFRKVNNKLAILYDKHNTVTGVAPIRKDYPEVKAFIFELTNAIEPEIKKQEKEVNNNDISLDTKKIGRKR